MVWTGTGVSILDYKGFTLIGISIPLRLSHTFIYISLSVSIFLFWKTLNPRAGKRNFKYPNSTVTFNNLSIILT